MFCDQASLHIKSSGTPMLCWLNTPLCCHINNMWCESHLQVIIRQLARTRLLAKSLTRKFMVKGFLPYSVELLHSNDLKTRMIGCCMTACDVNSPSQVCKLLCMVERILLHCFCVFTSIVAACGGISGVFCQSALPSKPKVRTHIRHAIFTFAGACCP